MLKKIPDLHKKTVYILLCVSLVFTVIQTILAVKYFEPDVYLYAHGTVLADIYNIALSVFVIGVLILFAVLKKDSYPDTLAKTSGFTKGCAGSTGICLLGCGINNLFFYSQKKSDLMYITERQDKFIMWAAILAWVGFLYFIFVTLMGDKVPKAKIWVGCVTIAWHIVQLLAIYFDMSNPLNNPMRLINEFALVGAMMYLVVEVRFLAGIPKKGFYISTSVIAFTLLMASSVSNIALSFKTAIHGNTYCYIYQFVMALYILSRLISQLNHNEKIEMKEEKVAS